MSSPPNVEVADSQIISVPASERPNKWVAAWLSLVVPGAGQLYAGSVTAVAWISAAVVLAAALTLVEGRLPPESLIALRVLAFAGLGALSAGHARRLCDPSAPWPRTRGVASRVVSRPPVGRSVALRLELDIPLPVADVWRRAADVPHFLTLDPFHDRVTLMRPQPAAGVDLILWHDAFGAKFARFGRLLRWREGECYTFSDLSPPGERDVFPHVFHVEVAATPGGSRLSIEVKGSWRAPLVPVPLGMIWLGWVMREHARLLSQAM